MHPIELDQYSVAIVLTFLAALLSLLIGAVTARIMRLGGFIVVLAVILGLIFGGWMLGLPHLPGPWHVVLIVVMLQAGFLAGALATGFEKPARHPAPTKSDRVATLKSDSRG